MCSAALDAFGATRTLFAPIQQVKSAEVGFWPSETLDSLIGSVLANQCGVWEGQILCALCFSMHSIPSFPVLTFCSPCTRLAVMSIQDELICLFGNASLHV